MEDIVQERLSSPLRHKLSDSAGRGFFQLAYHALRWFTLRFSYAYELADELAQRRNIDRSGTLPMVRKGSQQKRTPDSRKVRCTHGDTQQRMQRWRAGRNASLSFASARRRARVERGRETPP